MDTVENTVIKHTEMGHTTGIEHKGMDHTETKHMETGHTETRLTDRKNDNVVFIGKKRPMSYVLAVVTQFNNGANEVIIKARGKVISMAVDVEQIVKNRFMPNCKTKSILTKTEELTSEDGSMNKVSAIEIVITK